MRRLLSLYLLPSTLYPLPYHTFNKVPIIPRSRRNGIYIPLATPATAVVLPNGATLDITIYQAIVLTLGALIFIGALVCAAWTTGTSRGVLVVAAVLPALTLVVFRAQAPMLQKFPIGGCDESCLTHPERVPYQPIVPGTPLIDPFWFMAPAAALGLLTAGIAFLPATRRRPTP